MSIRMNVLATHLMNLRGCCCLCFPIQSVQILSQGSIGETFSTGFESLLKYFHFGMESILHIMVIATALTILRLVLEWIILKASFKGLSNSGYCIFYVACCGYSCILYIIVDIGVVCCI